MDLSRLRLGELLAGLAALGLLVVLFLAWNRSAGTAGPDPTAVQSGWSAIGPFALLFVLTAVGLALTLVIATATMRPAAIQIGAAVLTTAVAIVVALGLLVRVLLLDHALAAAYLGLVAMLLIAGGGWLAMADERTRAPYSAAPDLPRRPAPPVDA
jgi:hypothetical protein